MSRKRWEEAEALAARGAWSQAATHYVELAEKAERNRDAVMARQAASAAADALRRDDRPAAAARMLRLASRYGQNRLTDRLTLSAVLMDAGEIEAALDLATQARSDALLEGDPGQIVLARDTLLGTQLSAGLPELARTELQSIEALNLPGAQVARSFRQAQLDRLDGLLIRAQDGWRDLAALLAPYKEADGPRAACFTELAELAVLAHGLGASAEGLHTALEDLDQARQAWARAGRRAGLYRAEAWILRVQALLGETVISTPLDRALDYATERGMVLLRADLHLCRAIIRRDPDEAAIAARCLPQAPFARGRAGVVQAELGGSVDWAQIFKDLAGDTPWSIRALRASPDAAQRAEGQLQAEMLLLG